MNVKVLCLTLFVAGGMNLLAQKNYQLQSPDGKLKAVVEVDKSIEFSVSHDGTEVLALSPISMSLQGGEVLGADPKVSKVTKGTVNKIIPAQFYKKTAVTDTYNAMTLLFKGNYSVEFRAYNDGLATGLLLRKKEKSLSRPKKPLIISVRIIPLLLLM